MNTYKLIVILGVTFTDFILLYYYIKSKKLKETLILEKIRMLNLSVGNTRLKLIGDTSKGLERNYGSEYTQSRLFGIYYKDNSQSIYIHTPQGFKLISEGSKKDLEYCDLL